MKNTLLTLATALLASNAFCAPPCELKEINPPTPIDAGTTSTFKVGDKTLSLADYDQGPAWAGPLTIVNAKSEKCVSGIGIIEKPLAIAGNKYLYVSTYSGSEKALYVLDTTTCKAVWKSRPIASPPIMFTQTTVRIGWNWIPLGKNCLPREKSQVITDREQKAPEEVQ